MQHKYYFPDILALIRAWAVTYKEGIGTHGTTLGLTAPQIAAEQAKCDDMISAIDDAESAMADALEKNSEKEKAIKDSMDFLRPKIKDHKNNANYTEAIGKALGVIGAERTLDPTTVKTTVHVKKVFAGIEVKFTLEGCGGGYIYCKRGAETAFAMYKYITHPQTIDDRPNLAGAASEQRQYYVVLAIKDNEVGQASDIVTISN
ncbi:MAG: hypothetical protein WCH34_01420 [Bacteroidota bacterium]